MNPGDAPMGERRRQPRDAHPFPSNDVVLPNGHMGHVFVVAPEWAWDLTDLKWVPLTKIAQKG